MKRIFYIALLLIPGFVIAQSGIIAGRVVNNKNGVDAASVIISGTKAGTLTDTSGYFKLNNLKSGAYTLEISATGYVISTKRINVIAGKISETIISLEEASGNMEDVVVTGTLKAVSRTQSPVPVEVYTPKYFQKNPSPSLFESIGMVNGVKPQLNCNVCNTGDIHINGMEGPYTMILIDGMPIVSALSTVYGLNGIPNSLVERIEVVKGPGSSLYGSEAMGGIVNVITKNPAKAANISADLFATSWQEYNADFSIKAKTKKAITLLGINYFNYQNRLDKNGDNFTDVTLQNRISIFNKWSLNRKMNRVASLAARYVYEDRWGGEMNWNKEQWRGSDSVYGESIYTNRLEILGAYQLPTREKIMLQFSYNRHNQDSYYGKTAYMAQQNISFVQLYWDKQLSPKHTLLAGASYRYTFYDDNTPATASKDGLSNLPSKTGLPGVLVQDEWTISNKHKILAGYRYDYDEYHGSVHSPRLAYKWSPGKSTVRASFGTGFRVVNLFTEDHAALTGAREVIVAEELKPERSYNSNLNYTVKLPVSSGFVGLDVTGFYSYFTNKINGDFDTDPNKIIYKNLDGYAVSQGVSLNTDINFSFPLKILAGVTYMNVYQNEEDATGNKVKEKQLFAPKWSGTFAVTYNLTRTFIVDFTGTWNGPMRLPIVPNDYRPEYSPTFCIANIQLTKKLLKGWEIYGGIKNLFNFIPEDPFMRPFDPFDKHINDPVNNPYNYTFDPGYNFASMQGIRGFLGIRYNLFK